MNVHRILIVIEDAGQNHSAYSPDLPAVAGIRRSNPHLSEAEARHELAKRLYGG